MYEKKHLGHISLYTPYIQPVTKRCNFKNPKIKSDSGKRWVYKKWPQGKDITGQSEWSENRQQTAFSQQKKIWEPPAPQSTGRTNSFLIDNNYILNDKKFLILKVYMFSFS